MGWSIDRDEWFAALRVLACVVSDLVGKAGGLNSLIVVEDRFSGTALLAVFLLGLGPNPILNARHSAIPSASLKHMHDCVVGGTTRV